MSSRMVRRSSAVNNNFLNQRRTVAANNSEPDAKNYCIYCGIRLHYSARLNNFFCSQCGFTRKGDKFVIDDVPNSEDNNRRKGPLTSDSNGSNATPEEFENMKIKPLPNQMSRSRQSFEDTRRRSFQGYDNDMKRLEKMGYNIVNSYEHIPADNGSTYDSNEARGSFANLQSQRRVYYR
jgi:hypothetical protein